MAELIAIATVPKILNGTWIILKAAYGIHDSVDMRKTQIRFLLDRCRDLMANLAQFLSAESETALSSSMRTGIEDLEETCQAVMDILEKAKRKGFLWCIINQSNIDSQVLDVESRLTSTFENFNFIAHIDRDRFQQDMRLALETDHANLVAKLDQLSVNDQRIIDALQEHGGMQRRMEELLVAVHKCIQDHGSEQSPEAKFLRNAGTVLQRMSQGRPQMISGDWVVTSLEVDFDTAYSIGQGSFGRVYTGQWHAALVAIKQMYIDDARTLTEKSRKVMYKEVKLWTTLHHPNILNLYGACLEATMPFLVMQYCRFGNLCQYLLANTDANRINLSYDIVAGMTYLHSRGIIHADLKGVNILVDDNHNALVADFGLSQAIDGIRSQSAHSTRAGARGTLRWMAPECLDGEQETKASDVYSLGLTIWEIFSDEVPFANIADRVIPRHVVDRQQRPARPSRLESDALWRLVQSCWVHDPASRPSMSALQRSLARYTSKLESQNQNTSLPANPFSDSAFPVTASTSVPTTLDPLQSEDSVEHERDNGSVTALTAPNVVRIVEEASNPPISSVLHPTSAPALKTEIQTESSTPAISSSLLRPNSDSTTPTRPKDKSRVSRLRPFRNRSRHRSFHGDIIENEIDVQDKGNDNDWRQNEQAYLTATASKDWALVFEVCECASSSEENAKEAVRTLRREFKHGTPQAQLSAAHLWAIILQNCNETFITQCASKKFVDTVEDLLKKGNLFRKKETSPVVRKRVMDVLAAAAYASGSNNALTSLWKKVKPPDKPDEGVPLDSKDPMISPPILATPGNLATYSESAQIGSQVELEKGAKTFS